MTDKEYETERQKAECMFMALEKEEIVIIIREVLNYLEKTLEVEIYATIDQQGPDYAETAEFCVEFKDGFIMNIDRYTA